MGETLTCSYCKKPKTPCFKVVEQKGQGVVERAACFPCISEIGEKVMVDHRKELAASAPPTGGPS